MIIPVSIGFFHPSETHLGLTLFITAEMAAAAAAKDSTAASTTGTATADNPIPEGTTNQQDNQHCVNYTGTGHDVRDPRPSDTSNQYNLPPRGRGRGRSGGTWQPVTKDGSKGGAQTLSEAWETDYSGNWSSNPTASSSSSRGRGTGRGGRGRGRAQHYYEDWIATAPRSNNDRRGPPCTEIYNIGTSFFQVPF